MSRRPSIRDQWSEVEIPPPPEVGSVDLKAADSALLILDVQRGNCNAETRPRCMATLPAIEHLLAEARRAGVLVVYSLTRGAGADDIRPEVAPGGDEPVVKAGVDKFHGTELEELLRERGIQTVVLTGTSAHGAVLHTAAAAAARGLRVVVPLDCISATEPYAEQYTAWHIANSPGTRRQAVVSHSDLVHFAS